MRILLVEDNSELSAWLSRLLRQSLYVVDCIHSAGDAIAALETEDYGLVLLDLALPDGDGLSVLKAFRARNKTVPVIIMTANDAVSSRVRGFDSGADDYLIKPVDINELEARIRARLRLSRPDRDSTVACGPLALDTGSRQFALDGQPLALTPREHAVLEALLMRAGRPVQKAQLVSSVFGFDDEPNPAAVEIYVHRVRKKLEGSTVSIVTLRGLGYVLAKSGPAHAHP